MPVDPSFLDRQTRYGLMSIQGKTHQSQLQALQQYGAQQLSQYGPEGQMWAERLQKDPQGAMQMAEQMGGFAGIEQRLAGAQAQGRMAEAMSASTLSADQLAVLQSSPQQFEAYMKYAGGGAAVPFDIEQAKALRKDYTARSGNFETIRHFYEIAVSNAAKAAEDPENPGAVDFALVQAYGKMLDPESVVRQEEGNFIVESQSSTVADKINAFTRLFSAAGTLNPTARRNLMRQIQATYEQAASRQTGLIKEMEGELDRLGADGVLREFSLPIGLGLAQVQLDLSPWEVGDSKQAPVSVSSVEEAKALPPGTIVTAPNGYTFKILSEGMVEEVE